MVCMLFFSWQTWVTHSGESSSPPRLPKDKTLPSARERALAGRRWAWWGLSTESGKQEAPFCGSGLGELLAHTEVEAAESLGGKEANSKPNWAGKGALTSYKGVSKTLPGREKQ